MESTRSEKQEGTHGGCGDCEVAHQHHPNTHHQMVPKTTPLITLVLAFPPMESQLKEGKGWL